MEPSVPFELTCPSCGIVNECATPMLPGSGAARPGPGSLSVCIECGGLSVVTVEGFARPVTADERAALDPMQRAVIERAIAGVHAINAARN